MRKGFTLIEIVMTTVVICLVAAIIIPRFGLFIGHWEITTEARKLRSHLREVQQEAISRQTNCDITFYPSYYEINVPSDNTAPEDTITLPSTLSFSVPSAGSFKITFDRLGAADFSVSGFYIVLSSNKVNRNIIINVQLATGMVKIQ